MNKSSLKNIIEENKGHLAQRKSTVLITQRLRCQDSRCPLIKMGEDKINYKEIDSVYEHMNAESAKRCIWMNLEEATGELITVDRQYLSFILHNLEVASYERGYTLGYKHRCEAGREDIPIEEKEIW